MGWTHKLGSRGNGPASNCSSRGPYTTTQPRSASAFFFLCSSSIERRSTDDAQAAAVARSASMALTASPLIPFSDEDERIESWWSLLPEDIVAEILLRLPIKPLFQNKCISKRYESIISDQAFAKRYRQLLRISPGARSSSGIKALLLFPASAQCPRGLSKNARCLSTTESLGQDEDESSISIGYCSSRPKGVADLILASSNGLILSICLATPRRFDLYVSNPLTKQWAPIPEPTEPTEHYDLLFCIATRPESYKIVLVRRVANGALLEDNAETTVEIFCSVSGQWAARKRIRGPGEVFYESMGREAFSYKGVLHWLARGAEMVITYDPYDSPDRFGRIPLPERRYPRLGYMSLIYSGDEETLRYCEMDQGGSSGVDRLMVWRRVVNEWRVQGEFCFPSLHRPCRRLMVALDPCDPDVVWHPYVIDCKVMVVNLRTRTWKLVEVLDPSNVPFMYSISEFYVNCPFIRVELCPWSSPFYKLAEPYRR